MPIDRRAIAYREEAAPVVPDQVAAELAVGSVIAARVAIDMAAIDLWEIVPRETDLHDGRVPLAQKLQAIANDQLEVDDRRELADSAKGLQGIVLQVQEDAQLDRVAIVSAMPGLHLALKEVQNRLQHAAECEEQDPLPEALRAPQKEAKGREAAALE